jgi:hypothetical protein
MPRKRKPEPVWDRREFLMNPDGNMFVRYWHRGQPVRMRPANASDEVEYRAELARGLEPLKPGLIRWLRW